MKTTDGGTLDWW